jgi:hypothetical protein
MIDNRVEDRPAGIAAEPSRRAAHRILWCAAGITVALLLADLVTRAYDRRHPIPTVREFVNVDLEANLPTWWNSTLLLAVAGMALAAALLSGRGTRPSRLSWLGLAAVAALLSLDETIAVHERLGQFGTAWKDWAGVALPTHAWVLPGALIAVVGTVIAVVWARGLPRDLRNGLLGALAVFLTGALVVETFNGWAHTNGHSVALGLGTIVEEGLEMAGCIVALAVLSRYVLLDRDPATGRTVVRLRD